MSMIVLCPSRGRPDSAHQVQQTFRDTSTGDTVLQFIVDEDDETRFRYPMNTTLIKPQDGGMGLALNEGLKNFLGGFWMYGFVGDDHRFRTNGWDTTMMSANIQKPGIYYAFDGVRADLPTNWFVDGAIVESLGWLSLPSCKHFYLDDAWRELGNQCGCLYYMGDITIEHLHYSYGKSKMDPTYERNLSNWQGGEDQRQYEDWRWGDGFRTDADLIRSVLPL